MSYAYTDEQLNYLNRGEAVYSVNSEYAERKNKPLVTSSPNPNLSSSDLEETNTLTTPDGQRFRVIATKSDPKTGFDGMAVAPIVNGDKKQYDNVIASLV